MLGEGGASDREKGGGVLQVDSSALSPFLACRLIPNVWILLLVVLIFHFLSMKKHGMLIKFIVLIIYFPLLSETPKPLRFEHPVGLYHSTGWRLEAQNFGMDET